MSTEFRTTIWGGLTGADSAVIELRQYGPLYVVRTVKWISNTTPQPTLVYFRFTSAQAEFESRVRDAERWGDID